MAILAGLAGCRAEEPDGPVNGCLTSTDCALGSSCVQSLDGNTCRADSTPPAVSAVVATCFAVPCLRDGMLHVEAAIADDTEVLDAAVSFDVDVAAGFPMARSGETWIADVPLRELRFDAFERDIVPTVVAHDGARNVSNFQSGAPVPVTRLRWIYDAGAPLTSSPAVLDDGTAVVGVAASTQLLAIGPDGKKRWSLRVGTQYVNAAPAVGASTIWVGNADQWLYGVEPDGSAIKSGVEVATGGAVVGSVAVVPGMDEEWALATSAAGFTAVVSTVAGRHALAGPKLAYSVGPVIDAGGMVYGVNDVGLVTAYRLITSPVLTLAEAWSTDVGIAVDTPMAVDASGALWTVALNALSRIVPGAAEPTVTPMATFSQIIVDSPVILANGDIVAGGQEGTVFRIAVDGPPSEVWIRGGLGGPVRAPIVVAGGDAVLLAPTGWGNLFALRDDGSDAWSKTLDVRGLGAGNIHTPGGQTGHVMSTAYFPSPSGKLYAVIVDGELDGSSPWPKAFHDPRNTNRAGPQP
jgi:hypothetical protein